jgi:hypothetical protein
MSTFIRCQSRLCAEGLQDVGCQHSTTCDDHSVALAAEFRHAQKLLVLVRHEFLIPANLPEQFLVLYNIVLARKAYMQVLSGSPTTAANNMLVRACPGESGGHLRASLGKSCTPSECGCPTGGIAWRPVQPNFARLVRWAQRRLLFQRVILASWTTSAVRSGSTVPLGLGSAKEVIWIKFYGQ